MLTIDVVLKALRTSRAEFRTLFLQAQTHLPGESRVGFEAIAPVPNDRDAFAEALRVAQARGWFESLVDAIIDQSLEDGTLAAAVAKAALERKGDPALQAMVNLASRFSQPHVVQRGMANALEWTGKISVDGVASGTGVLVGPNLVLTAWHVVRALFQPIGTGGWEPDSAAGGRLSVEFDDYLEMVGRSRALRPVGSLRVSAHQNWCVTFCKCHDDELSDRLPADLAELDGLWDYAVIRLASTPGLERRWATDAHAVVPKEGERIIIFQHPAGQPLKLDENFIAPADESTRAFVPRLRFLHFANTLGGSSGGPCFDKSMTFFGLHQGEWVDTANGGQVTNRGIPLERIMEHVRNTIQELPAPDPSEIPVWTLGPVGEQAPVIGREPFQKSVWQSAVSGRPRLLAITGDPGTGKSFYLKLLSALLPDGGHLRVALNAQAIGRLDAAKLTATICTEAGATVPPLADVPEVDSTRAAWLRDEVVPKIVGALEGMRNGRLVWLSIADLNQFEIGKQASELLLLMYEQTRTLDWLRVVLDGMRGDVPDLGNLVEWHRTTDITEDELMTYLRRFTSQLGLAYDEMSVRVMTRLMLDRYQLARSRGSENAMLDLKNEVVKVADEYVKAVQPT